MDRVVIDTNILISAFVYDGKPKTIFELIALKQIKPITSPSLISELIDVLVKKFHFSTEKINSIEKKIKRRYKIIHPRQSINIISDKADNRVLEAAIEGNCNYIITGDKDLLSLGEYKGIKIVTVSKFLGKDILSLSGKFKPKRNKPILKAREELEKKYKRV